MTDEIIKLLDELAKRFGVAIDWADENVMPYLLEVYDRFITYQIVLSLIPIVLFMVSLIITITIALKTAVNYKNRKDSFFVKVHQLQNYHGENIGEYFEITENFWVVMFVLGLLTFALGIETMFEFPDLLKAIFVPELSVVEFLKGQM